MEILVLGVNVFRRKDGSLAARVLVASTPRSPNFRGLAVAEFDALPDVADSMTVLPAYYRLDLDLPIAQGFGRNEVRPLITGARLVAALVPDKKGVPPS